jgi:hypothetical protein
MFLDKILGIFIISRYTLLIFCCQGSFAILFHSIFNAHISSQSLENTYIVYKFGLLLCSVAITCRSTLHRVVAVGKERYSVSSLTTEISTVS